MRDKMMGTHAIVLGGSMAGLMATRVLSDHFERVTMIERDKLNDTPEARKGQPQARHTHGLLAAGLDTMLHYFPDLKEGLLAQGAMSDDMGAHMRWYVQGGYRRQYQSGMTGAMMSRPLLEWQIRQRVVTLSNVAVLDGCNVVRLITAGEPKEVTGVEIDHRAQAGHKEILSADLVVDATGRGSASPKWLTEMGYAAPQESEVKVNVGYATRIYRRGPNDLPDAQLILISPQAPHDKRGGFMFPIEGDRWTVTLGCWSADYPPTDEAGYLEFARSLAAPDIYNLISRLEPLSEIVPYRYPASIRRHYEKLQRFPAGYLVIGDAFCSFNPVYGQGMTSATSQAAALDHVLQKQPTRHQLARAFFKEANKVIDITWQLSVGEDFRYPETVGPKAPGTDLINAYISRVHQATHNDTVVYGAFLQVLNLLKPPTSLFHPKIVWRVLRNKRTTPQTTLHPLPASF
jgi:2-polyprenyl-6-methoxyphenol hydroxylase-like FAD-dependent oxidoreductase